MPPALVPNVVLLESPAAPTPGPTTKIPGCVTQCFAVGNTTACGGFSNLACLCDSPPFLATVQECWLAVCIGDDFHFARGYIETLCASVVSATLGGGRHAIVSSHAALRPGPALRRSRRLQASRRSRQTRTSLR